MSTFPAELTGTWEIDGAHSTVGFAAKHAVVATTRSRPLDVVWAFGAVAVEPFGNATRAGFEATRVA